MSLAERVKALREKQGRNQKELADSSGVTQASISRIESGQVEDLKAESLKSLATALGVTVDYLVGRTDRQSASDIADADPAAMRLLRQYADLSAERQRTVREFVEFLHRKERSRDTLARVGRIIARRKGKG